MSGVSIGSYKGQMAPGTMSADGRLQWDGNGWVPSASAASEQKRVNQQPYDAGAGSAGAASKANDSAFNDSNRTGVDYSVDPTGRVNYSNESAQASKAAQQQRGFAEQDRASFLSLINSGTQAASAPFVPKVAPSAGPSGNEADARAAAFARAKDQAGKIARNSLTSIAENMAGRNMTGGGLQSLKEAGAVGGVGDSMQELNRDQMMLDLNRSSDVADRDYEGALTQRGQDVASRGQDLANRASYLSLLRSLY